MNAPSQHERTFLFRASAPEEREKGASMRRTAVDVSSAPGPARLGSTGRARTPGTRHARLVLEGPFRGRGHAAHHGGRGPGRGGMRYRADRTGGAFLQPPSRPGGRGDRAGSTPSIDVESVESAVDGHEGDEARWRSDSRRRSHRTGTRGRVGAAHEPGPSSSQEAMGRPRRRRARAGSPTSAADAPGAHADGGPGTQILSFQHWKPAHQRIGFDTGPTPRLSATDLSILPRT